MLECVQISRNVQWVWMIATNLLFAKIRWEVFSANVSWAFKEMAEYALVNPSHSFMFRVVITNMLLLLFCQMLMSV